MFSDFTSDAVEFLSSWRTEKKVRVNCSQTSEILTYEVESQTRQPREAECQTESLLELMKASQLSQQSQHYDEHTLAKFLQTAETIVTKQLKVNVSSASLYANVYKERDSTSELSIVCEHTLEEESVSGVFKTAEDRLEVTSVSWSSSGATIAVAYGTNRNVAWSDSRSYLCLWNLDRPKLKPRTSDQKLELESSIQAASFHPQFPGYVAAGLFSGVVLIWDLAKDEVAYSSSSHEDPVTCLCWMESSNSKYIQLLSGSTDGRLMVWRHRKGKDSTSMNLEKQFQIRGINLPRRAGVKGSGPVGVTCMSPGKVDASVRSKTSLLTSSALVVGCENGSVLKCNIDVNDANPVEFTYEGHVGPVYSVDWSPFNRHLFLSCSTDQVCRIYHSLQSAPLREIRPEEASGGRDANYLYSAAWSPTRPLLFYAVGTRGRIEACDVTTTRARAFSDVFNREGKPCQVNTMQINNARPDMIASGCAEGLAHAWRVGARLVSADDLTEEAKLLEEIANEAMAAD